MRAATKDTVRACGGAGMFTTVIGVTVRTIYSAMRAEGLRTHAEEAELRHRIGELTGDLLVEIVAKKGSAR